MQIIDDKDLIRATRSIGSPPRRKPPPVKKTIEDEAVDAILSELKEVFMKDVRSRIVNPMILDCLDPAHYKDIRPKPETAETPIIKTTVPEVKVSSVTSVKQEPASTNRLSITNRIPLLPRFRKKGEPVKEDSVRDRKLTKADVRPMHHQFNHYSDSEDEDETPHREGTAMSDDEDESSRPSRETTTLSTPEPSRVKKTLVRAKDVISVQEEPESDEELLKDILDKTKDEGSVVLSKRKRAVDFTSSEDEDEPSPPKKICLEPEVAESTDAMEIDEPIAPKLSKAAILKAAKAKAAALRRAKKAETKAQEIHDSIEIEAAPVDEIKPPSPAKVKIPEVEFAEIEDDDDMLLDLDGVQSLVRDKEDYRYLAEALKNEAVEPIHDIWTWSWMTKKFKALNFDGAQGFPSSPQSLLTPQAL
jgi:[histone H3]-lysine4 N-trimethyltransferase SETD1